MPQTPLLDPEPIMEESKPRPRKAPEPGSARRTQPRATAETMARGQRDISVSEFFAKNRHLLGFDNPRKALLTTVKEAVDNALDACEEAGILPDVAVVIEDLDEPARRADDTKPADAKPARRAKAAPSSRYRVTVIDNGPGIVRKQVENIFGRLLYGSKFHRLKMSRGQQGIGISAAGMYGLITTGRPMVIHTRPDARKPAHHIELAMNTKTNRAEVTVDTETEDFPPARLRDLSPQARALLADSFLAPGAFPTGTSVSIELEGRYQRGRGSVDEFLELTAIANPHASLTFIPPGKASAEDDDALTFDAPRAKPAPDAPPPPADQPRPSPAQPEFDPSLRTVEVPGAILFPRGATDLPPETREIQPHPRGIELGILLQMLKEATAERETYTLYNFLQDKFSRVSSSAASTFCQAIGVTARTRISDIEHDLAERLFRELQEARLPPPPTDCLAPIGVRQLLAGMLKGVRAEFYAASSREPAVYRGRPFLVEAAIAFGGDLPADDASRVIRFANRVPLLYQQSACSAFKAVVETNWRNYDLQQPRGGVPSGPLVVMIHMASVWVPFTSESKEAIADYDDIRKEMRLALMECGRKLGAYLRKRQRMRRESERRDVFERYIGEIAKAAASLTATDPKPLYDALLKQAKRRTEIADARLDQDGKTIRDDDCLDADQGVLILPAASHPTPEQISTEKPPTTAASGTRASKPAAAQRAPDAPSEPEPSEPEPAAALFDDEPAAPSRANAAKRPTKKVLKKVLKKVRRKRA